MIYLSILRALLKTYFIFESYSREAPCNVCCRVASFNCEYQRNTKYFRVFDDLSACFMYEEYRFYEIQMDCAELT